jgi:uncharacterized paraquat-inducible protein A
MDLTQELLLLGGAIVVLILAVLLIQRRQRMDREALTRESPFATSTEGQKRCPNCGMFNLSTARDCVACHRRLPG